MHCLACTKEPAVCFFVSARYVLIYHAMVVVVLIGGGIGLGAFQHDYSLKKVCAPHGIAVSSRAGASIRMYDQRPGQNTEQVRSQ